MYMPKIRKPLPLTTEAFAPFGDVMEMRNTGTNLLINEGYTRRFHDLAKIDVAQRGGRAGISIFRSTPLPTPVQIRLLERHPLSSQAFFPLSARPYLVVVAPPGNLDEQAVQVFLAQPGQGVNYRPGTWHHFCLALEAESDFLVIDRIGTGENCDQVVLQHPFEIDLA